MQFMLESACSSADASAVACCRQQALRLGCAVDTAGRCLGAWVCLSKQRASCLASHSH